MKTFAITAVMLTLGLTSSNANAASRRSLGELAHQLENQSICISREVTRHFRFAAEYRHLSSHARDIYRSASYLHKTTSRHVDLRRVERDAYKLAHEINELEITVRRMQSHRLHTTVRRLPGGRIEYRIGHRYYSRYQLRKLASSIHSMEHTLRELQTVVKSLRYAGRHVGHVSPIVIGSVRPTRVHHRRKGHVSFSLVIR